MRADRRRGALLLGLLLSAGFAAAAAPPFLDVAAADGGLRVGDRLAVTVAARGGDELLWGTLEVGVGERGPWALVEGPRELEGAQPPAWELVLVPLEPGELALPSLSVAARDPQGVSREVAAVDPPTVEVRSVLPEGDDAEPLPLRAPLGVGGFPWEYVVPLSLPVLGLAAGLAWWARRRRPAGDTVAAADLAPLPELEILLDRLEARVGRDPVGGTCDRLAGAVRRYLARQTGEPAEDMTSFELRLLSRRLGWPDSVQRGIQEVMGLADRVRFGRAPTDDDGLRRGIALVRETAREIERLLQTVEEAAG